MTNEIIIRHMEYDDFYIDRTGESLYSTGSITIDWGDGTTETTNNNTYSYSHNYRDFVEDDEGIQTYAGYITVTISGVEEIRDDFLSIESFGGQYIDAVTIPNNITSIGNNFCYNQEHLHYLTLSNSLTTIGDDFCYGCYLSNGLELPDSLTSIGNNFCNVTGYLDTLALPDNITTIGDSFCASSALTSFTIPNSIVSIGDYFLDGCSLLTGSIIIPNSVENIGNDFLTGCGITSIIFETNSAIDGIPDYFACSCMNLTSISFPDNLEAIGTNFCCNCPSLTRVEFPEGLIEIGENFLNGEGGESVHLNKLIFPSSFRYLNYGLSGSSIDKVIFKSVIPADMSAGYPDQFDSMIIHVPKNCTDAYANAFTEAFGDYGEDSLSDPNHYRENLTLPEATAKFGTLMRTNLKRKGIETQRNDGLTTLINKVNDIETNDMTGFLADIGFYDASNWSGISPTVLEDRMIFSDEASFSFDEIDFPDTFTWLFIISSQHANDSFGIGVNAIEQPSDTWTFNGYLDYEEIMVISRENGEDFNVDFIMDGFGYVIADLTETDLNITPATSKPIVIRGIRFSEETYENIYDEEDCGYKKIRYKIAWDKYSNTRPPKVPVLLLKNDKLVKKYDVNANSSNIDFLIGSIYFYDVYNSSQWGCYYLANDDDASQYSWRTLREFENDLDINNNYSVIKHINGTNEKDRLDYYVECDELYGYDEPDEEVYNIISWPSEFDSRFGHFDYLIQPKQQAETPSIDIEWGCTFEYTRLADTNNDAGIWMTYQSDYGQSATFFGISDDQFKITHGNDEFQTINLSLRDYNIITIHQTFGANNEIEWKVQINDNNQLYTFYDSQGYISANMSSRSLMQAYQTNAKISNFYYWSKKKIDYVVDTTSELINALNNISEGETLHIKNGTYTLSQQYSLPSCTITGDNARIMENGFIFDQDTHTPIDISGITFDGNNVQNMSILVEIDTLADVHIHNCTFTNKRADWNGDNIYIHCSSEDYNIEINDCIFTGDNYCNGFGHSKASICYDDSIAHNISIHHNIFNHNENVGDSGNLHNERAIAFYFGYSTVTLDNCVAYCNTYVGSEDTNFGITESQCPD